MTTQEAFKQLVSQRGWYKLAEIDPNTARSLKKHFNDSKISLDKMEQILVCAGYKKIPENWKLSKEKATH